MKYLVLLFALVLLLSCQAKSTNQKSAEVKESVIQTQEEFDKELEYMNSFPLIMYTPTDIEYKGIPVSDFNTDWIKILIFTNENVNSEQLVFFRKYDQKLSAIVKVSNKDIDIIVGCFEDKAGNLGSFVAAIDSSERRIIKIKNILIKPYVLMLHHKDGIIQLDYKFNNHPLQIIDIIDNKVEFEDVEI